MDLHAVNFTIFVSFSFMQYFERIRLHISANSYPLYIHIFVIGHYHKNVAILAKYNDKICKNKKPKYSRGFYV